MAQKTRQNADGEAEPPRGRPEASGKSFLVFLVAAKMNLHRAKAVVSLQRCGTNVTVTLVAFVTATSLNGKTAGVTARQSAN
jgi:hypothetical protein